MEPWVKLLLLDILVKLPFLETFCETSWSQRWCPGDMTQCWSSAVLLLMPVSSACSKACSRLKELVEASPTSSTTSTRDVTDVMLTVMVCCPSTALGIIPCRAGQYLNDAASQLIHLAWSIYTTPTHNAYLNPQHWPKADQLDMQARVHCKLKLSNLLDPSIDISVNYECFLQTKNVQ